MIQLSAACQNILSQLESVVQQIDDKDFVRPSVALGQSTVGQHLRHTIEFFLCLESGFHQQVVNYDKRDHDHVIESDKVVAAAALHRISKFVDSYHADVPIKLEVGYDRNQESFVTIETNYQRELVYNIEHAVHHMAIMKIGIREVAPYVVLPADFGIAVSTLRYKEAQPANLQ